MMDASPAPPPQIFARVSRRTAAMRKARVLARVREGRTYRAIAEEEGLSLRRVRRIVNAALEDERDTPAGRRADGELARLAPAMALAEKRIAEGDLSAVRALVTLQKRLDIYVIASRNADGPPPAAGKAAKARQIQKMPI